MKEHLNNIPLTLQVVPVQELLEQIELIFDAKVKEINNQILQEKLLSPEETCRMFHPPISRQTLHNWWKKGLLQKHCIGRRTYYRYGEILATIERIHPIQSSKTL